MYYNSSNPVDLKRAQTRFESLIKNGKSLAEEYAELFNTHLEKRKA